MADLLTADSISLISSLGLMGVGGYLVIWITQRIDKRQEAADLRHETALKAIYEAMEKLADRTGQVRDCILTHDGQAKIILEVVNTINRRVGENEERFGSMKGQIDDLKDQMRAAREKCNQCRSIAKDGA